MKISVWRLIVLSLVLSGCASVSHQPTETGQLYSASQVAHFKKWQLDGRIAYQNKQDSSGFSAGIAWVNQPSQTHLDVIGPLGVWRATITDNSNGAELALSDGSQFKAQSIEALMKMRLTWSLPVDSLKYWLFAMPEPKVTSRIEKDRAGSVLSIKQGGWYVTFPEYQLINGYKVPKRLVLSQDAVQIKLVIQHWSIQS